MKMFERKFKDGDMIIVNNNTIGRRYRHLLYTKGLSGKILGYSSYNKEYKILLSETVDGGNIIWKTSKNLTHIKSVGVVELL